MVQDDEDDDRGRVPHACLEEAAVAIQRAWRDRCRWARPRDPGTWPCMLGSRYRNDDCPCTGTVRLIYTLESAWKRDSRCWSPECCTAMNPSCVCTVVHDWTWTTANTPCAVCGQTGSVHVYCDECDPNYDVFGHTHVPTMCPLCDECAN